METTTLVRASVQGIVFLINSAEGLVYTYNPDRPVFVGTLEKIPEDDKNSISKTNGCMATARVRYRKDIREVMATERALMKKWNRQFQQIRPSHIYIPNILFPPPIPTTDMESLLLQRKIRLWEFLCQQYTIPKSTRQMLDTLIRKGEEIPYKRTPKESR